MGKAEKQQTLTRTLPVTPNLTATLNPIYGAQRQGGGEDGIVEPKKQDFRHIPWKISSHQEVFHGDPYVTDREKAFYRTQSL